MDKFYYLFQKCFLFLLLYNLYFECVWKRSTELIVAQLKLIVFILYNIYKIFSDFEF